ncbi:hypothetical protein VOLCADRAFT_80583 [Volvox carteri f. nagariensis]|uniref:Damage-control phosphatase ARMT1-like metal-binding domain-containing protein n=1 Tax=Volvox carteri f. nagariensis TaxID=3068 RepID=D8TSC4_VOLCA|nr:uncharacterized protein VOLCADRAFT_80583 [Volvox carteri f. nagariensis]EFJ49670.1 hypothetical protein VOLCADRAFT_80583 [Volvox carteri f. nagariensis]|eukprot:XP_002949177.1 hypothetical protein VOLCADRAFT_80583 [Volvox carteri f. nagariensis]
MVALRQLAALGYTPCTFDYGNPTGDLPTRGAWIEVFRKSIPTFKAHALTDPHVPPEQREAAARQFEATFNSALDALLADPSTPAPGHPTAHPVNCYTLCQLREECLHAAGFQDIFAEVKAAENERALALLPGVLRELDEMEGGFPAELELALRGVFAGNIFDLGAAASAELHAAGGGTFAATRAQLLSRPWAVDNLDEGEGAGPRWRQAAVFVDNAGTDVVLGILPFARVLIKAGTRVILMANRGPTINDITARELEPLLLKTAALDAVLQGAISSGQLRVVCSGSDLPVIDLTKLSPEAVDAAAECDLIVLEGMGRAIETNLHAQFTCDSLKLGMIKHPEVAAHFGKRLYDCVCKYDKGVQQA